MSVLRGEVVGNRRAHRRDALRVPGSRGADDEGHATPSWRASLTLSASRLMPSSISAGERAEWQPEEALAPALGKERETIREVEALCGGELADLGRHHPVGQRVRDMKKPPSGRVASASGM